MRLTCKQFVAVAGLTVLEAIRQPIFLLIATSCIALIALMPAVIMQSMGEPQRMIRDSALALHLVGGLVLSSYVACSTLRHELRRGTVSAVLVKPVQRGLFFVAKFAGVAVVMAVFSIACGLATLLSARATTDAYTLDWWASGPAVAAPVVAFLVAAVLNYYTRRPFVSTAFTILIGAVALVFLVTSQLDEQGRLTRFGARVPWATVPASVLITMATLVFAAVAVALATRLDTVPNLSICSVIFLVGLMSDYWFGRHADQSKLFALLYGLIPNWQNFWVTDALHVEGGRISWWYVGRVGVYAMLYSVGALSLGMLAFRRLEIKG